MLTNQKLSEGLNIPLSKIRRYTKEFMPPDPIATRRSGYTRRFSNNDGFFIYLGGTLVMNHGFTYEAARWSLQILRPWFLNMGYVPNIPRKMIRSEVENKIIRQLAKYYPYSFIELTIKIGGVKDAQRPGVFRNTKNRISLDVKATTVRHRSPDQKDSGGLKYHDAKHHLIVYSIDIDNHPQYYKNFPFERDYTIEGIRAVIKPMVMVLLFMYHTRGPEKSVAWEKNFVALGR
jgi:hypothetical protein